MSDINHLFLVDICHRYILTGTKLCVRALPASSPTENRWLYNTFYYRCIQLPNAAFMHGLCEWKHNLLNKCVSSLASHDCNRKILPGLCLYVKSKLPCLIYCVRLIGGKVWLCSFILTEEKTLVIQEGNNSGPTIRVADTCVDKLSLLSGIYWNVLAVHQ